MKEQIQIIVITTLVSFLCGRYTSRLEDYRRGKKGINKLFYEPFMNLFWCEHHAYAMWFADMEMETQEKLVNLLLKNRLCVPYKIENRIIDLDQCYSGIKSTRKAGEEVSEEEKNYIENIFQEILVYVEQQYRKNEWYLYHTFWEKIQYIVDKRIDRTITWIKYMIHSK